MKKLALALLLFVKSCGQSYADDWTESDYSLQVAATAMLVADWAQTRYIAKHPDSYFEYNPILGLHPSVDRVDLYFISSIIGTTILADYMPSKVRKAFLAGETFIEFGFVQHNLSIGIGVGF